MDRSKDSDPQFATEINQRQSSDVIVALIFESALAAKSYWSKWQHWDKAQGAILPLSHDLEGYHVPCPEDLSRIRQGGPADILAHQGELEWLMDIVWDIKHHDDSRPIPLPTEAADPYWTQKKGAGNTQVVICGMWLAKTIIQKDSDETGKIVLKPALHRLPDFEILTENQWLFEQIKDLLSVEIIVVSGGTSKFNPNTRKSSNQQILKSFKWVRCTRAKAPDQAFKNA